VSGRQVRRFQPERRSVGFTPACTRCETPFPAWGTCYVPVVGGGDELCWTCWNQWKIDQCAKREAA